MTWIQDAMDMTAEVESPKSFVYWCMLTTISAVMRKNVYLNKHFYRLYPNIYTMLQTDSGGRKGFPVWMAETLVQGIDNTKFITGRNSIEGIIKKLGTATTSEKGGPPLTDAGAFIVSGEFHELLVNNDSALSILTSLYDTHSRSKWEYALKNETIRLKDVCITLLGASNEALLRQAIPEHAIQGGFIGRMLCIPDDGTGIVNPLTDAPKTSFEPNKLLPYLQALSELNGEFHYTTEANDNAKKMYEDWYRKHRSRKVKDPTGTFNRLHDQILKVSMLLSLSRSTDLLIHEKDLDEAITQCQAFTLRIKSMYEGTNQTKSMQAEQKKLFLKILYEAPEYTLPMKYIMRHYYTSFELSDLIRIKDDFTQTGVIHEDLIDREAYYRLAERTVNRFKELYYEEGIKNDN
jgi:hypothetical protein